MAEVESGTATRNVKLFNALLNWQLDHIEIPGSEILAVLLTDSHDNYIRK